MIFFLFLKKTHLLLIFFRQENLILIKKTYRYYVGEKTGQGLFFKFVKEYLFCKNTSLKEALDFLG